MSPNSGHHRGRKPPRDVDEVRRALLLGTRAAPLVARRRVPDPSLLKAVAPFASPEPPELAPWTPRRDLTVDEAAWESALNAILPQMARNLGYPRPSSQAVLRGAVQARADGLVALPGVDPRSAWLLVAQSVGRARAVLIARAGYAESRLGALPPQPEGAAFLISPGVQLETRRGTWAGLAFEVPELGLPITPTATEAALRTLFGGPEPPEPAVYLLDGRAYEGGVSRVEDDASGRAGRLADAAEACGLRWSLAVVHCQERWSGSGETDATLAADRGDGTVRLDRLDVDGRVIDTLSISADRLFDTRPTDANDVRLSQPTEDGASTEVEWRRPAILVEPAALPQAAWSSLPSDAPPLRGADVDALAAALIAAKLDEVGDLLDQGVSPDAQSRIYGDPRCLLEIAAIAGTAQGGLLLLRRGARPDGPPGRRGGPLAAAVQKGVWPLVESLLARRADPELVPPGGSSATAVAREAGEGARLEALRPET